MNSDEPSKSAAQRKKLEQLREDVAEGLNSGPAALWNPEEIKAAGRVRRAFKAQTKIENGDSG